MIQTSDALSRAWKHAARKLSCGKVGNFTVEPAGEVYQAAFVEMPMQDALEGVKVYQTTVQVQREKGKVGEAGRAAVPASPYGALTPSQAAGLLDGMKAYELALAAIKGHETYDKFGPLTTQLVGEEQRTYEVTFPLMPEEAEDPRSADYAYRVVIDAKSGQVLKILVPS
ncbi:MAG TPA: hypothetical protein VM389_08605 [Phycisphaerae bacterium]|nr:hypothetical protein [Phycisphaerae bacterium]HUU22582.1 hypothetical protein [Phycisphaerae bacterium]